MIAGDESVIKMMSFPRGRKQRGIEPGWCESKSAFRSVTEQLDEYFQGDRINFSLPLSPDGTEFQQQVWQALLEIPYGHTTSYGDIAKMINRPTAARAVGTANGANPIPIIIPCHRVIGSTGKLTGFGGGISTKKWLLAHEKKYCPAGQSSDLQQSLKF